MTIRERIAEAIGGKQLQEKLTEGQRLEERFSSELASVQNAFQELWDTATLTRLRTPEQAIAVLREYDSATVLDLLANLRYGQYYTHDLETQRKTQLWQSRRQWLYSPLSQWAVWTWTSYGLGEGVKVTCNDPKADELWQAAWKRNSILRDDRIHSLSNNVLVEGNDVIACYHSIADGATDFEYIDLDEITGIVTDPENKLRALFYKREFTTKGGEGQTWYYPNYEIYFDVKLKGKLESAGLPEDAKRTDTMNQQLGNGESGTVVTCLHIAHNLKDSKSLWGWPILGIAYPYMQAQNDFIGDRLTIVKQKASFVREFITKSGSRGVADLKAKLSSTIGSGTGYTGYVDSNPPPITGSSMLHNDAIEHRDLPMTTGAGDAHTDWEMITHQALIGAGLFPVTAGMDTARWATAVAMDKTQAVQWSRFQTFWACQFRKMVDIVLLAAETWGSQKEYKDKSAQVSIDTLSLVDLPGIVTPISSMISTGITPLVDNGTLPVRAAKEIAQALWNTTLTALGVENANDILSDVNFGIVEPEQAAETAKTLREIAFEVRKARLLAEGSK